MVEVKMRRATGAGVYVVTVQARALEPHADVVAVFERVLRRASGRTGVHVHDRAVWSSGVRLVVDAPEGAVYPFVRLVTGQAARELSSVVGWRGTWARPTVSGPHQRVTRGDPILLMPAASALGLAIAR
jgi:hypothetical protein